MPNPGEIQYPAAGDTALTLIEVNNNALSTLTAGISVSDLLIPVADPGKFPNSGFVTLVDSLTAPTKIEIVIYTSKSASNLVVPAGGFTPATTDVSSIRPAGILAGQRTMYGTRTPPS